MLAGPDETLHGSTAKRPWVHSYIDWRSVNDVVTISPQGGREVEGLNSLNAAVQDASPSLRMAYWLSRGVFFRCFDGELAVKSLHAQIELAGISAEDYGSGIGPPLRCRSSTTLVARILATDGVDAWYCPQWHEC